MRIKFQPVVFLLIFLLGYQSSFGQWGVHDGDPHDSTYISFGSSNDTLVRFDTDTSSAHIWQIGNTSKPFFADTGVTRAIMTDTSNAYTVNVNDWFSVPIFPPSSSSGFNFIVSFMHKYETTAGKDGGVVEFSNDGGLTWQNVKGECNGDSTWMIENIVFTSNFYTKNDTLEDGTPAFSGNSGGWQYSRVQFWVAMPVRTTGPSCDMASVGLIRFRFVSDSIPDSLDGWMIDDINVERDLYSGVQNLRQYVPLNVYPNPSSDGNLNFPVLPKQEGYSITIINTLGVTVYNGAYTNRLKAGWLPKGLYYYNVSNGNDQYTGKILIE